MDQSIKWGIIGLGKIAGKIADALKLVDGAELYAVASRTQEKAVLFGSTHAAEKSYGSYEELVKDSAVDVVYIATPHVSHAEMTLLCLNHGKSVLCEKPFAMNRKEVELMIDLAKEKQLFLMEAMWTRFIPATEKVLELIQDGVIGELRSVHADFGFSAEYEPGKRLFNKSLGGGALLDIGIYPLYLSYLILGQPQDIQATAHIGPTGVDHSVAMLLSFAGDRQGILHTTLTSTTQTSAWIHGSEGSIYMHPRFHHCDRLSVLKNHEEVAVYDIPFLGNGYCHEIIEVAECLRQGKTQSSLMSWEDSLALIDLLDGVRDRIGLVYE